MVFAYKLITLALAYGALWDALSRWRVRAPERHLQLQVYGCIAFPYLLLLLLTGGYSDGPMVGSASAGFSQLCDQFTRGFFAAFGVTFLLLGTLEMGISLGLYEPSLPLLSRWWMRALFEGPVWRILSQRRQLTPLTPEEAEACLRHAFASLVSVAAAVWGLQVTAGLTQWGHLDPVALVIALKAINIWLDARLWHKIGSAQRAAPAPLGYSVLG